MGTFQTRFQVCHFRCSEDVHYSYQQPRGESTRKCVDLQFHATSSTRLPADVARQQWSRSRNCARSSNRYLEIKVQISSERFRKLHAAGANVAHLPRHGSLSDLREQNLARVMQTFLSCRPMTREQIERSTGLGPSSLTKLVEDLKSRSLISEDKAIQNSKRGRPIRPLKLSTERWMLLGAILDRQVIQGVVSFLDLGVIERKDFPVPIDAGLDRYLDQLKCMIEWAVSAARKRGMDLLAVELASPGATNRSTGEVIRALPNNWEHLQLAQIVKGFLAKHLTGVHHAVAVSIDRIANYSMTGRLNSMLPFSAPRSGTSPIVYFGGRSALSGGLYDGSVMYGVSGLAGEYGHLIVDPAGISCWCGRAGCLETKIGLPSLHAQRFGGSTPIERLSSDGPRLLQDLVAARDGQDEELLAILVAAGHWLAIAMDAIASVVNPGHVVVDGYLAQLGDPLISTTIEHINKVRSFPAINGVDIIVTDGDPSWILKGTLVAALLTVATFPSLAA